MPPRRTPKRTRKPPAEPKRKKGTPDTKVSVQLTLLELDLIDQMGQQLTIPDPEGQVAVGNLRLKCRRILSQFANPNPVPPPQ